MSTADDDEKTITGPPTAGRQRAMQPGHTLASGTRLRDYEITGLIGEGGFGIVYLAWDHSLQRQVAIKEYMPASMAARVSGSSAIVVKSERHLDTFRAGLKSFVNEARLLARFDHPSLVKVYRFWEENGTAYMVMPYYEGPTLKAALAAMPGPPDEDELRAWLRPLLDALTVMHASHCYHRDIAPDNILLTPRGPLLLDFGAARRVIGDMTHAITVVLKPGYAPIEQYGDVATMAQGAWTDLYALASVVYYAITGRTPTSSVERLMDDRLEPLSLSVAGRYSEQFLHAIDAALALRPADRPQDARQFRALLDLGQAPSMAAETGSDSGWSSGYGTGPGALAPDPGARPLAPHASAEDTIIATQGRTVPSTVPVTVPAARAAEHVASVPPHSTELDGEPAAADATRTALPPVASVPAAPSLPAPRERKRRGGAWAALAGVLLVALAFIGWLQPRSPGSTNAHRAASAPAAAQTPSAQATATETPTKQGRPTETPAADSGEAAVATPATQGSVLAVERPASIALPIESSVPAAAEVRIEPAPNRPDALASAAANDEASGAREAAASVPSAPSPRPARPRRETTAQRGDSAAAPARPVPAQTSNSRCSDILQKASLEPLTATEAAYLKRECR